MAVLVLALITTRTYSWLTGHSGKPNRRGTKKKGREDTGAANRGFVERAGGPGRLVFWLGVVVAVFVAINVLFYSSFFTNYPKGVSDSLKTFEFWTKTGKEAHVHPFLTYISWLQLQESPLLFLGALGAAVAVNKPARSFALFSAVWAFGIIAAYSLIAYKTPWLALNFIVPLALSSESDPMVYRTSLTAARQAFAWLASP